MEGPFLPVLKKNEVPMFAVLLFLLLLNGMGTKPAENRGNVQKKDEAHWLSDLLGVGQSLYAAEIPAMGGSIEYDADTSLARRKQRLAEPLTGPKMVAENSSVRVYAGDDGRFTIGTTGGKSLLYGFGREGATSHTHFKIGSNVYGTYSSGEDHPPAPELIAGPTMVDSSIVHIWRQDDVIITQSLTPVMLGSEGKVFIEYTFENVGSTSLEAGLLLFFDTMIAHNDYAPIATEYGYFSVEREFLAPTIPVFWQAYESSPFQTPDSLVGEGIMVGSGAVMPDRLVYGDYWHYKAVEWDYIFAGGPYSDSSILYRWDERPLAPGASLYFSTYYGQGAISSSGGSLMLSLASPGELEPVDCFGFSPNPFNLNVIVANTSDDVASGIIATIDLPEGFDLVSGLETGSIDPPTLGPGESGTISWSIRAEETLIDSSYTLNVSATAPGLETFSASRNITIATGDRTAPEISLIYPDTTNTISSSNFMGDISMYDESGIDPASFRIKIGDRFFTLFDTSVLELTDGVLHIDAPFSLTGITDGPFSVEIYDVADIYGCSLPRTEFGFVRDITPPELSLISPHEHDTIYVAPYTIRFGLDDEYSSLEIDSLRIVVNSTIELNIASSGVSFDGEHLRVGSTAFEAALPDEYPLNICLSNLMDRPDQGLGNRAEEECFNFYFNGSSPACSLIAPDTELYYSCERIAGEIMAYHPTGINTESIMIYVDGEPYAGVESPNIDFDGEIITFDVPIDGTTEIGLTMESISGVEIPYTGWTFLVDRTPPGIGSITDIISSPEQLFEFTVNDTGAGLDESAIEVITDLFISGLDIEDGTISFMIHGITGCDSLRFGIVAADMATGCGANSDTTFFSFPTPCNPPEIYSSLIPDRYRCDPVLDIRYLFTSSDLSGDLLGIEIGGHRFTITSPEVSLTLPELSLDIPSGIFAEGENMIVIEGMRDPFLVEMTPETSYVLIDTEAPRIIDINPEPGDTILSRHADIRIHAEDILAGINWERCFASYEGSPLELTFLGSRAVINLEDLPLIHDSDFEICLSLVDSANGCGGNSIDTCFVYHTDFSAPYAELLSPVYDEFFGCSDSIVIDIYDDDPLDPSSLELRVGEFTYDESAVSFDGTRLRCALLSEETGTVVGISIADIHGNTSESEWTVLPDFTAPIIQLITDTTDVGNFRETLRFLITDNHAGVMWSSLILRINGTAYSPSSEEIDIHGDTLVFTPSIEYLEHNIVSMTISDNTEFCRNSINISFTFDVSRHVPLMTAVYPMPGLKTGCDEIEFCFTLDNIEHFDLSSLIFSPEIVNPIELRGDSVFFEMPSSHLDYGENTITVTGIRDHYGHVFTESLDFTIFFDNIEPDIMVHSGTQMADSGSFMVWIADESGILDYEVTLNAEWHEIIENGDSLLVSYFSPSDDTLVLRISATDDIHECNNSSELEQRIVLSHPEYYLSILEPLPNTRTHVIDQPVFIRASARHPEDYEFRVNGVPTEMEINEDGIFAFLPEEYFWEEGENHIHFTLEGQTADFSFDADFTPPSVELIAPEQRITDINSSLEIAAEDMIAGIDQSSIWLTINGETAEYSWEEGIISVDLSRYLLSMTAGESLMVNLEQLADNTPDYGMSNICQELFAWTFIYTGKGWSVSEEKVLTPNGDLINDFLHFSLPIYGEIEVFDKKGRRVNSFAGIGDFRFYGKDENGDDLPPGIYIYVIKQQEDFVRKGSIVIAR